jgi:hypothetical protein
LSWLAGVVAVLLTQVMAVVAEVLEAFYPLLDML